MRRPWWVDLLDRIAPVGSGRVVLRDLWEESRSSHGADRLGLALTVVVFAIRWLPGAILRWFREAARGTLSLEVRLAVRSLVSRKVSTLLTVVTLILGLALSTTALSFALGLTGPLPVPRADQVVAIESVEIATGTVTRSFTAEEWRAMREVDPDRGVLGAYTRREVTLSGDGIDARRLRVAYVTPSTISVAGVVPQRGRFPHDALTTNELSVLVSDDIWQEWSRAGLNPAELTIEIDGRSGAIVGSMPVGFGFPFAEQAWIASDPAVTGDAVNLVARLSGDASSAGMVEELSRLWRPMQNPAMSSERERRLQARGLVEASTPDELRYILLALTGVAVGILVLACVNVGNLLLARVTVRAKSVALRFAVGATRASLARELIAEASMMFVTAVVFSIPVTLLIIAPVRTALQSEVVPYWIDVAVSMRVTLLVGGLVCASMVVAGMIGTIRAWRSEPSDMLRGNNVTSGLGTPGRIVMAIEVMLGIGILAPAAMVSQNAFVLLRHDGGYNQDDVLVAQFAPPDLENSFLQRLIDSLEADARIEAAAVSTVLPGGNRAPGRIAEVRLPGQLEGSPSGVTRTAATTSGYVEVFEIPMLAGRDFDPADAISPDLRPVLVNRNFADSYLGGVNQAVGSTFELDVGSPMTVVGVMADVPSELVDPDLATPALVFDRLSGPQRGSLSVSIRSSVPPLSAVPELRRTFAALDSDIPLSDVSTMRQVVIDDVFLFAFVVALLTGFGILALLFSALGVYGIASHEATARRREVGVRVALGAGPLNLIRSLLQPSAVPMLVGFGIGCLIAIPLLRAVGALRVTGGLGSAQLLAAVLALSASALLAAMAGPVRQGIRTDPRDIMTDG